MARGPGEERLTNVGPKPLAGLAVIEQFGASSASLGRVAVAFAGLVAAKFGATVIRIETAAEAPARHWKPLLADGQSALFRFLNEGKRTGGCGFHSTYGCVPAHRR